MSKPLSLDEKYLRLPKEAKNLIELYIRNKSAADYAVDAPSTKSTQQILKEMHEKSNETAEHALAELKIWSKKHRADFFEIEQIIHAEMRMSKPQAPRRTSGKKAMPSSKLKLQT